MKEHKENIRMLLAAFILGNAGLFLVYILPQMIATFTLVKALNTSQTAWFGSADLMGAAAISFFSLYWIRKVNVRRAGIMALFAILLGNLISLFDLGFGFLFLSRFFAGLGQGLAIALSLVIINDSLRLERNFALFLIVTLVFGALGVILVPEVQTHFGQGAEVYLQAATAATALFICPFLLPSQKMAGSEHKGTNQRLSSGTLFGLAAVLIMFVIYGGLWAFTEQLGIQRGLDRNYTAWVLSLSLWIAIPGLLFPILVQQTSMRLAMIAIGLAGLSAYALLLLTGEGKNSFLWAALIGSFSVNMVLPYMTGLIADQDNSGNAVVLIMPMYSIGFSLGPMLLSLVYGIFGSWPTASFISLILLLLLALFFSLMRKNRIPGDKNTSNIKTLKK